MINGGRINYVQVNQPAAYDEEYYQLWLRNPASKVGHIVHINYNGTSAVYPSWVNYTVKLSDFPLAGYRDVIKSLPSITRAIDESMSGHVSLSIGEMILANTDGNLDQWHNLSLDGQIVRIFQGDPEWLPERFRMVLECIAEAVTGADEDQIAIRLRAVDHQANTPIQTNMIPSAVGSTAPSNNPIDLAFGTVFNAAPDCIDEVNQVYQFNDGAVTSLSDGRDSGVPFRTNQISISAVNAGTDTLSTALSHGFVKNTRVRCDVGSLPVAATWRGIAWNGTIFCAVASGSAIAATSQDGITWTLRTMPATAAWTGIAWNGTVFVVTTVGSDIVATSPDGITWTQGAILTSGNWYGIAWNGAVFCALAYSGNFCATSPDGVTWTSRSMPSAANWYAIAWNGSVFCAIAYNSTVAATSPDGITWTAQTLPASTTWYAIAWNGSVFCAIANNTSIAATSPDGVTWTQRVLSSSTTWEAIAWNGSVFCIVASGGTSAATSPDGITWTARTLPVSADWYAIAWGGYVFCTLGQAANYVALSSDGITWSQVTSTLPAPLALSTDYWVHSDGLTTTDFKLSATRNGAVLDITGTTTGAPLVGFHWTSNLTTGKIYLDQKPAGEFTIDGVSGSTSAATILPNVLGTENVDTLSQANFAVTCAQNVGIYVGERRNRLDVAQDIMAGLGAWYGYNRFGMLQFGRIESSYANHDLAIPQDYMVEGSFKLERMIPPAKRHRAGYRKNWTDQTGKLAAGVSTEMRGLFSTPYSVTAPALGADEGSDGSEFHALAEKPDVFETMMALASEALTEAQRRNTMFYGWGAIFRFEVGLIGSEIDIGKVLLVTHTRYGFGSGVRVPVVSVEDRPSAQRTVVKVFAALSAYVPGQI